MSLEKDKKLSNEKLEQLEQYRSYDNEDKTLTTNQGLKLSNDDFSLKAGVRGPTLLEDFHLREKITHFDHERIPERVVHARGFGVHGEFRVYESLAPYTKANFLQDPSKKTPVFVRFSTVIGSRGSKDTARDVRGFATKFYTDEGIYDLVANNIPVFFMQDALKFPDFVHANKPEPHNEIPQATASHDTFWDWMTSNQESAHMVMWVMSDRALPRSFRMMEGFGVNTFRFVNAEGKAHFVKFHWKPKLGVHSLYYDEADILGGKDPDYHRRDIYENIEAGNFPEYELGVQLIAEEDEFKFDFDILDPTKLWPEEEVPVKLIGKMTLNRNVDNFFAETEQVAFHPGNVVPGIDFSNDPLLQGRLFSYLDTQLTRLGGPNFHEIPINRSICPFHNNQRDGFHRQTINVGNVSYHKNRLANNSPYPVSPEEGGYEHYQERVDGKKIRARSESFKDHFSQATMFWNSLSDVEKQHIVTAFSFEVGKVRSKEIKQSVVDMFANVNLDLAKAFALNIGCVPPANGNKEINKVSPALSQANTVMTSKTRRVAILIDNGFDYDKISSLLERLTAAGVNPGIVSSRIGVLTSSDGRNLEAMHSFITASSVLFDGVYIEGGKDASPAFKMDACHFVREAFKHYKAIAGSNEGKDWLQEEKLTDHVGVFVLEDATKNIDAFVDGLALHRLWTRAVV